MPFLRSFIWQVKENLVGFRVHCTKDLLLPGQISTRPAGQNLLNIEFLYTVTSSNPIPLLSFFAVRTKHLLDWDTHTLQNLSAGSDLDPCLLAVKANMVRLSPHFGVQWSAVLVLQFNVNQCSVSLHSTAPAPVWCWVNVGLPSSAPSADAKSVPHHDRRPDDRQHFHSFVDNDDDQYLFWFPLQFQVSYLLLQLPPHYRQNWVPTRSWGEIFLELRMPQKRRSNLL